MYRTILARNDREWFDEVVQIEEKAKLGGADTVWRQWLDAHVLAQESDDRVK